MGKSKDLATGETRFVNTSGDSMTGALSVSGGANSAHLTLSGSANRGLKISTSNPDGQNDGTVILNAQDTEASGVYAKMAFQTAGTERMKIDNAGRVTTPNQPAFWVQAATNTGDYQSGPIVFSSSNSNVTTSSLQSNGGTHFNTTNGRFTAPVAGLYQFNTQVRIDSFGGSYSYATLWDSGATTFGRDLTSINTTYYTHTLSATRYLSANDYVYVTLVSGGDSSVSVSSDSWFSGFLIG